MHDDAVQRLAELEARKGNKKLFDKIKERVLKFTDRFRRAYAEIEPTSRESKIFAKYAEQVEKIHEIWSKALVSAAKSYKKGGETYANRAGTKMTEALARNMAIVMDYSDDPTGAGQGLANLPGKDDVKYSIRRIVDEDGTDYGNGVYLDSTLLSNLTDEERVQMVKEYIKELGGQEFTAFDKKSNRILISIAKANEKFKNKKGNRVYVNHDLATKFSRTKVKQEAIALIDELITTAKYENFRNSDYPHGWLDDNGKSNWDYWKTYLEDGDGVIWEATLNIANANDGRRILFDIFPIKRVGRAVKSAAIPTNNNFITFSDKSQEVFEKSSRSKTLNLQTEYLDSKSYTKKKSAPALPMQNASAQTSTTQGSRTSNNNISQSSKLVNTKTEKVGVEFDEDSESANTRNKKCKW